LILAEFTNHALIEIMQFRHLSSCGRLCLPSTSSSSPGYDVHGSEVGHPHGDEEIPMEGWCCKRGRSMYQTVSLTDVGPYGHTYASMMPPLFTHSAANSEPIRSSTASIDALQTARNGAT